MSTDFETAAASGPEPTCSRMRLDHHYTSNATFVEYAEHVQVARASSAPVTSMIAGLSQMLVIRLAPERSASLPNKM